MLLTLGVTVVVTAGLVRKVLINDNHIPERIASIILNTSEILPKIALAIIEIPNILSEEPRGLLFQKNETETKYWTRKFPASED